MLLITKFCNDVFTKVGEMHFELKLYLHKVNVNLLKDQTVKSVGNEIR